MITDALKHDLMFHDVQQLHQQATSSAVTAPTAFGQPSTTGANRGTARMMASFPSYRPVASDSDAPMLQQRCVIWPPCCNVSRDRIKSMPVLRKAVDFTIDRDHYVSTAR